MHTVARPPDSTLPPPPWARDELTARRYYRTLERLAAAEGLPPGPWPLPA